jgi:hypothetical protein
MSGNTGELKNAKGVIFLDLWAVQPLQALVYPI